MISKKFEATFFKTTHYLNKKSFIIQISIAIDMETFIWSDKKILTIILHHKKKPLS